MAMVKCKECGGEISDSADSCPKCGAHLRTRRGCGFYLLLFIIIGAFMGIIENFRGPPVISVHNKAATESCVRRGVVYFTEIGSYPKLSDGRNADAVARERCKRTTTAF
jgi:uncharacterized paraquat-inducible protein A